MKQKSKDFYSKSSLTFMLKLWFTRFYNICKSLHFALNIQQLLETKGESMIKRIAGA